jgi:hypothetical protein
MYYFLGDRIYKAKKYQIFTKKKNTGLIPAASQSVLTIYGVIINDCTYHRRCAATPTSCYKHLPIMTPYLNL